VLVGADIKADLPDMEMKFLRLIFGFVLWWSIISSLGREGFELRVHGCRHFIQTGALYVSVSVNSISLTWFILTSC
jgi:hypothetical protein